MVRDKIDEKTDLSLIGGIGLVQPNNVSYHPNRAFTSLGSTSQKSLSDYMRKVANFIQLARKSDDNLVLDLKVESYALRRKLSNELQYLYKDRNLIFTQFSKSSQIFTVRKWKAKEDGDTKEIKEEVKVTEQECENSAFDTIAKGNHKGVKVLHEDEKCIAFEDLFPVAKVHFIVLAKDPKAQLTDEHDALAGHLMVVASKAAKNLGLEQGYRVVLNNGKNTFQTIPNLYVHVIGGQQLKWPPHAPSDHISSSQSSAASTDVDMEETKQNIIKGQQARQELFDLEMGFSLVIEAIIKSKVPVIGHNCMYDWLYLFNQFCGPLPDTYVDFATEWHKRFPHTYDTKVLAFNSKHFFKTSLGQVYEKCTADEKHKHNCKFKFDLKNGFGNYEGAALLSHYHEAAYDAYMTGVAFGHVLKAKEIDDLKFSKKKEEKGEPKTLKSIKSSPLCDKQHFASQWVNKMMMDAYGSQRYYNLVPEQHVE